MPKRILYILQQYPEHSETYIRTEIEAVRERYELSILSTSPAHLVYDDAFPFRRITSYQEAYAAIDEFKPDILHTHWLNEMVPNIAIQKGLPFTLRSHSFDTYWSPPPPDYVTNAIKPLHHELCLGILGFQYVQQRFAEAGLPMEKFHVVPPVVNVSHFLNRSPNGKDVLNVGAAIPKKNMEQFLQVAADRRIDRKFRLYPLAYGTPQLHDLNAQLGGATEIHSPVQPDLMPAEYKRHEWLFINEHPKFKSFGLPVCVAEAQASGVGVCIPGIRPDVAEYVGGAGFVYTSLEEAIEILSKPYPAEMRELGFEVAQRSDISRHIHKLTDLWDRV